MLQPDSHEGMGRATIEDVARQAGVSVATQQAA